MYRDVINLRDGVVIAQNVAQPLESLMSRLQHQDLSEEELEKRLPPINTWPELTWYMMLRAIEWGKHEYTPHQPNLTPNPPKYLFLQASSLRPQLLAMAKLCLAEARSHTSEPEKIVEFPGTTFDAGTACHGALLAQLENLMFAELIASHKSSWRNRVLGELTIFAGIVNGVEIEFPVFMWKVEKNTGQFRNAYQAKLAVTQHEIGGPPSESDSSSHTSDSSSDSSAGKRSLQKRTPWHAIPWANNAALAQAHWRGDYYVQMDVWHSRCCRRDNAKQIEPRARSRREEVAKRAH